MKVLGHGTDYRLRLFPLLKMSLSYVVLNVVHELSKDGVLLGGWWCRIRFLRVIAGRHHRQCCHNHVAPRPAQHLVPWRGWTSSSLSGQKLLCVLCLVILLVLSLMLIDDHDGVIDRVPTPHDDRRGSVS